MLSSSIDYDDEDRSIGRRILSFIRMRESFEYKSKLKKNMSMSGNEKLKKSLQAVLAKTSEQSHRVNLDEGQEDSKLCIMDLDEEESSQNLDSLLTSDQQTQPSTQEMESDRENDYDSNLSMLLMDRRKEEMCDSSWERMWVSITDSLNDLRNNDSDSFLEHYTTVLKLHVENKVGLRFKKIFKLFFQKKSYRIIHTKNKIRI
jgi:hypothetical protein